MTILPISVARDMGCERVAATATPSCSLADSAAGHGVRGAGKFPAARAFSWVAVAAALLVPACAPQRPLDPMTSADTAPKFVRVEGKAEPDDIARFLAGKPVLHGAKLSELQLTPEYAQHEREMRGVWVALTRGRVMRMENWSKENIVPATWGEKVLFYPFGGPDLLHAEALFGHLSTKILMGLEPVGWLPDLEAMSDGEILASLPAYRHATRTQMHTGFFITKDMQTDLDASVLRGVTPVLLATVSLMGGNVESVSALPAEPYQAVEIRYRNRVGAPRTVIYVRGDLSNKGFRNYRALLDSHGRGCTYFKAASYLMHDDDFSEARADFLARSNSILQDDSGIPFRFFAPDVWDLRCYGNYVEPIPLFAEHMQQDLRAAYLANPGPPLTFGSGYHFRTETANLLHAVRK